MRDKNRIAPFMKKIRSIWNTKFPDKTFASMLSGFQKHSKYDQFYLEDADFFKTFEEYTASINPELMFINPEEREDVIKALTDAWLYYPDWRFMQLFCNIYQSIGNPEILVESDKTFKELTEFLLKCWKGEIQ